MKKLVLTLVILLAFAFNGVAQQGSSLPKVRSGISVLTV